jgi:hypothetical protein
MSDESIDVAPPGARTEIIQRPEPASPVIVNPATGEALSLRDPTNVLADALTAARELEIRLGGFKRDLQDEILRRMDHERTYTAHLPGRLKLTGDGPRKPDYDGERLYKALEPLVPAVISSRARDNAVETTTAYKVKKAGINALLKVEDDRVIAAVKGAEVQNTKPRGVRVTPEP